MLWSSHISTVGIKVLLLLGKKKSMQKSYLQTRIRGNHQTIPQDRVPVFNVRATRKNTAAGRERARPESQWSSQLGSILKSWYMWKFWASQLDIPTADSLRSTPALGTLLSCPTPRKRSWSPPCLSQPYSLKCERAPKELFSGSEVGLFGWWAAEQEELVWGVHELQLLSSKAIANNSMSESHQLKTLPKLSSFKTD